MFLAAMGSMSVLGRGEVRDKKGSPEKDCKR